MAKPKSKTPPATTGPIPRDKGDFDDLLAAVEMRTARLCARQLDALVAEDILAAAITQQFRRLGDLYREICDRGGEDLVSEFVWQAAMEAAASGRVDLLPAAEAAASAWLRRLDKIKGLPF